MRLRRSELAVPASNPRMVEKSASSSADLVFLDLEDAVSPDKKEGARQIAIDGLNDLDWGNKVRSVRVNDHTTRWAVDDVISLRRRRRREPRHHHPAQGQAAARHLVLRDDARRPRTQARS